jgi:hypothetical protein
MCVFGIGDALSSKIPIQGACAPDKSPNNKNCDYLVIEEETTTCRRKPAAIIAVAFLIAQIFTWSFNTTNLQKPKKHPKASPLSGI